MVWAMYYLQDIEIFTYNGLFFIFKVITKAPLDCMCRPCTSVEEYTVIPQEIAGLADNGPLSNSAHFRQTVGL